MLKHKLHRKSDKHESEHQLYQAWIDHCVWNDTAHSL